MGSVVSTRLISDGKSYHLHEWSRNICTYGGSCTIPYSRIFRIGLLKLVERSNEECANLRTILSTFIQEGQSSNLPTYKDNAGLINMDTTNVNSALETNKQKILSPVAENLADNPWIPIHPFNSDNPGWTISQIRPSKISTSPELATLPVISARQAHKKALLTRQILLMDVLHQLQREVLHKPQSDTLHQLQRDELYQLQRDVLHQLQMDILQQLQRDVLHQLQRVVLLQLQRDVQRDVIHQLQWNVLSQYRMKLLKPLLSLQ